MVSDGFVGWECFLASRIPDSRPFHSLLCCFGRESACVETKGEKTGIYSTLREEKKESGFQNHPIPKVATFSGVSTSGHGVVLLFLAISSGVSCDMVSPPLPNSQLKIADVMAVK